MFIMPSGKLAPGPNTGLEFGRRHEHTEFYESHESSE